MSTPYRCRGGQKRTKSIKQFKKPPFPSYLQNNVCEFTPLFDLDGRKKKNIVSVSLFKMDTGHYKNFQKYLGGLTNLVDYIHHQHKDFTVRLFIDNSIYQDKNLFTLLQKLDMEIVVYSCPNFMIKDQYHYGLFGTLVRFFPLFDFPNNDAYIVIIQDSDFVQNKLNSLFQFILTLDLQNIDRDFYIMKLSHLSYDFPAHPILYKNIINMYTNAQAFVGISRVHSAVLTDYLHSVKNNSGDTIFSYFYGTGKFNKTDTAFMGSHNFMYGVDEYFMNNHFMKYLIDHKMPFININEMDLFTKIYHYFKYFHITKPDKTSQKTMGQLLNLILRRYGIHSSKETTLLQKFQIVDGLAQTDEINLYSILYEILFENPQKYTFFLTENMFKILSKPEYKGMYRFSQVRFEFNPRQDMMLVANKIKKE